MQQYLHPGMSFHVRRRILGFPGFQTFFILACTLLFSCHTSGQKVQSKAYDQMLSALLSHNVPELGVTEIDTTGEIVFLDARERNEYEVSHIKDAIWVGFEDFELSRLGEVEKNQKIVVYCSVGYRSEKISEQLLEAGYKDVSNLYGGIFEWMNREQSVVNDTGTTNQIHAYDHAWGIWVKKGEKVYR